jgi:hypothetical protein
MTQTTLAEFKKKALKNTDVKAEYERLALAHGVRKELIRLRKAADSDANSSHFVELCF